MRAMAPSTTITTARSARVADPPASPAPPMTTSPVTGTPVPRPHASTARQATPGMASRSGPAVARARAAAGRASRSVSR